MNNIICSRCHHGRVKNMNKAGENEFYCKKKHEPDRFDMCSWYNSDNEREETFQDVYEQELKNEQYN